MMRCCWYGRSSGRACNGRCRDPRVGRSARWNQPWFVLQRLALQAARRRRSRHRLIKYAPPPARAEQGDAGPGIRPSHTAVAAAPAGLETSPIATRSRREGARPTDRSLALRFDQYRTPLNSSSRLDRPYECQSSRHNCTSCCRWVEQAPLYVHYTPRRSSYQLKAVRTVEINLK